MLGAGGASGRPHRTRMGERWARHGSRGASAGWKIRQRQPRLLSPGVGRAAGCPMGRGSGAVVVRWEWPRSQAAQALLATLVQTVVGHIGSNSSLLGRAGLGLVNQWSRRTCVSLGPSVVCLVGVCCAGCVAFLWVSLICCGSQRGCMRFGLGDGWRCSLLAQYCLCASGQTLLVGLFRRMRR